MNLKSIAKIAKVVGLAVAPSVAVPLIAAVAAGTVAVKSGKATVRAAKAETRRRR